jgi:hypothetical protein
MGQAAASLDIGQDVFGHRTCRCLCTRHTLSYVDLMCTGCNVGPGRHDARGWFSCAGLCFLADFGHRDSAAARLKGHAVSRRRVGNITWHDLETSRKRSPAAAAAIAIGALTELDHLELNRADCTACVECDSHALQHSACACNTAWRAALIYAILWFL